MKDAEDIVDVADSQRVEWQDHVEVALEWFLDRQGQFYEVGDALDALLGTLELEPSSRADKRRVADVLTALVGDEVDPVQMAVADDIRHVGIIELESRWAWYVYTEYDDVDGLGKRAVCGECVRQGKHTRDAFNRDTFERGSPPRGGEMADLDREIALHYLDAHADITAYDIAAEFDLTLRPVEAAGELSEPRPSDAIRNTDVTWEQVFEVMDIEIPEPDIGATLASGTTIGGQTAIHGGNMTSFNVEDFGTSEVSTSGRPIETDGAGGLQIGSGGASALDDAIAFDLIGVG